MADYIISSGQFFDSDYCGVNDEIIVQSGGLMNYTSIPQYASSVTLEEGVYLLGVRIPVEINVQGTVAGFERNTLNISKRKPEDGLMLNDWSLLPNVSSLSLYVGSDQADGTYRLLGNAAGFDGTISLVDCFDAAIGELLLENPELDYEFRRYSLLLNEANELCLTVSSSLPESAGILLYKDGQLVDDSLQTVYDFDVPTDDYNHMFVVSGGYAEEINVYSGGLLTVMSGGVVDAVMVHLGMLEVSNGGKVKDLLLGYINVTISVTGGEVDGIRDNMYAGANAKLYVGEYGIVRNAETNGFREVIVDSNGLIENSLVAYGKIIALAGGTVSKIHGIWQGEADISVYGTSYDVILNSPNAVMFLHDGGKAFGTLLNGRDVVMTVSGGSAIETEVRSGFLHVSSGGTLKDTRLNGQYGETLAGGDFEYKILGEILVSEGGLSLGTKITAGSQTVSRGGIAERTEITSIGNMVVSNGGLASETSLSDDGRMVVSKGGLASETNLLNGGRLTVDHGGVARDVHASRYGVIDVGRFGLASSVVLDGYNMMLVSGSGRVEDVEVASGAEVYLYNGTVLGGRMQVAEGAVVYAFEGGTIDFDLSKASDTAPLFSDFSVIAGTPELTITVSADTAEGTYLLAARAAGFTGTITVQDETMLYGDLGMNNPLAYGWNTYTLNLKNDALSLTVTRNAEEAPSEGEEREIVRETVYDTIVHNGEVFSAAGGYAYYAPVVNSGGTLNVRSGAKMEETLVNRGGIINVESGGSADSTNVVWGEMTVLDGGSADGIRVDCATLTVSSGGKASNVVMSDKVDPATLRVTGGEVDGLYMPYGLFNHIYVGESSVIRNADVCGFGISGESTLTVGSGGILEYSTLSASPSTSVKQEAVVLAGGTVKSVVLAGGILIDIAVSCISVYGAAYHTELKGRNARLYLKEGGYASGTVVDYNNAVLTVSGASAVETEVKRGSLCVSAGGTILNTLLTGGYGDEWDGTAWVKRFFGTIHVSGGGLSQDTKITGGTLTISRGGIASGTDLSLNGRMVVSNGGLASETVLTDGGFLIVSRGGLATDVHAVNNGMIEIEKDAVASSVVLDANNTMVISGEGRVEDVSVASGGELYLRNGAVLGGLMQFAEGAIVSVAEGGMIDFDLSKANHVTALLSDLSVIAGAPDFTITVSADTVEGIYLLADGAAGFTGTISVQDDTMNYGDLGVNDSLVYGWNTYKLNLNEGILSLSVTRNAEEAPSAGEERQNINVTVYDVEVQADETRSVSGGYTFYEATVNSGGILDVQSGGKVEESRVNSGGSMTVSSGGSVDIMSNTSGTLEVLSGGKVTNAVFEDATIRVTGGELDGIRMASDRAFGNLYVAESGIVRNMELKAQMNGIASLTVGSGGLLEKSIISDYGIVDFTVLSGGTVHALCVERTISISVYGLVTDTELNDYEASLYLHEGGQASGVLLNFFNAILTVSGASAVETEVKAGAVHVLSGGTITDTRLNGEYGSEWDGVGYVSRILGEIYVSEGGLSLDTKITAGSQTIRRGGIASGTEISSSGYMILNGGVATGTVLSDGGHLIASHGGVASGTVLSDGGHLSVNTEGVAKDVRAGRHGLIDVGSDGLVSSAALDAYTMMMVSANGRAEDVNIASGANVYLYNGAVLGGRMQIAEGAVVYAFEGGTVDFALAGANATTPLIDNLSMITGAPVYTLTVSADAEAGEYLLAAGAGGFTGTITVQDETRRYGDLSVDSPLVYGWNTYRLNLNDNILSLTITGNDEYHEPEPEEQDTEIIVSSGTEVASGETLVWEKTGETVRVTSGGILQDTEIPWGGTLVLEEDAVLQGTVRLGADVQVNGPVNAGNADIELDISNRKEEYGVQINDMALLSALSCSVIVSPDQNKGEYILAGNARIFTGAITVKDTGGTYLGTITVEQGMLDYGITRYTLALNENDELVFIVSSNITDELDYVLLYKNDTLVLAKDSVMGVTLSTESEYDQLVVIDKGVAGKIEIGAGGVASVEAGGHLFVSDQDKNGFLRFDYNAGDSTVISGVNSNGEYFCVENDLLENVCGDIVNVTGKVLIRNYNGYTDDITWTHRGVLTMRDGAELTGTGEGGYYSFHEASIHDFVMKKAVECYFYEGATVRNTEWNDCNVTVYDNAFVRQSVFNTRVYLNGGTLSDVTFNSEAYINSYILVEGDLYFKYTPVYELWRTPFFDMNGHTAVFDYSGRDENDEGMIYLDAFSEDVVFQLNLNRDQVVGKYAVVSDLTQNKEGDTPGARRGFVDTYNICVDGIIVGTIDDHNPEFVSGNYVYTMTCENDTELYLTIDISDDMDETYNVLWYDADQMYHSASVSGMTIGTDNCQQVVVRNNGVLGGARIVDGGTLKVCAGGQAVDLLLEKNGNLRLNYTEDDATVVAGTNQYGRFFVRNNEIGNLSGENVTVSGNVSMHDYHGIGTLRTSKGVSIDGTFDGGNYKLRDTFLNDFTLESAMKFDFYSGTVSNAVFNGGNDVQLHGGTISDTVFNTRVNFELGLTTLANVVINNGFTLPVNCPVVIELAGDLTLNSEGGFGNNTGINVNGHTVNVNYQDRTVNDNGMFSLCCFSEDTNFRLLFREDQKVGTYTLAEDAGSLIDYFLLNIGGVDTEVLSAENREMDYGGYHYTLAHDVITQKITLTIDVSETDDVSFSVSYKDATEEKLYHSASVDGLVFDQDNYHDLVVKDHGIVMNSELGDGGLMTVESGGKVIILEQKEGSKLRFDYEEGDTTVISGMNQYGAFFVKNNRLENVYGESISVKGDVLIRNYHSFSKREMYSYYVQGGTLRTQDGVSISGILEGENGTFEFSGSTVCDLVATGTSSSYYFNDGTSISRSVINAEGKCTVDADAGCIEDTVFNKGAEAETIFLHGGTYSDVVINGDWSIGVIMYYYSYKLVDNNFCMDGDLTLRGGYVFADQDEQWKHGVIDANGNTITLDLTDRTVIDNAMLDIDRVYDAELRVVLEQTKAIGTFKLGAYASKIGQKESVYNEYTNEREYKMVGDLDGVISVYDGNGIELAACTINGDTEYYGRYNYTVFVDDEGYLKLKVGWNNRDQVYSADEQESNDTRETATVISGNGTGVLPALTIHDSMDVDWFMFTLDSPGRKSSYIGIDFKQWAGDLDINLYDSNGELIDYARSVTDNERLSLSGHTAGTYYLKVSGYNGNRNSYRLVYNLPEPVELEDDYENGDSKETPYFLSRLEEKITLNGSISRSGDQDYYMFVMSERGLVSDTITLAYDDEFGDLDLYLYDQNGTTLLVSSKNTSGGQECITMAGLQYGLYYAAVKSKNGSVGRYELVFDVNDREVNPDKYESNDSMKKATKLYTLNGEKALSGLSIHSDTDVDYYRFSILEKGSADDCITLTCPARLGDLDIEILNADGEVAAYSRTAEDEDTVSLNGLDIGEYYIRVYGGTDVVNNYTLNWHVTNSSLIPSDTYEGNEPILIREDQTVSGLSIAKVREEDETREDTFKIVLEYNAWKRSKIILTDYRSDWEDGMAYVIKDADGNVLKEGVDSEISLYGLKKGEYYLTLDAPNEDKYSEYSLIAQSLPDSDNAKDNMWSIFIYMAADNNLEQCYLREIPFMQKAVLPENVEVYVLMDRTPGFSSTQRNWTDTRVGKLRHSNGKAVAIEWMYFNGVDTDTYADTHNQELQQEWNTGDVATLEAFLDWGMKEGRADNYALIIKDHGSSLGYNCSDVTSNGSMMDIERIAELLRKDKYEDLSVVTFDQCLMGSDVVITTMEGTVDYVVASEAIGWTPNLLIMYEILFNSLETEMTPQEFSQKIVASCNASGTKDLTLASFKSDDHTLSDALNQFGALAAEFTFNDWVTLCKCYSKAHNYGDEICAYSDLGAILNLVKGYHETISSTLLDAANDLYDTLMNVVIDSAKITPEVYGTGLAVFNPVLSDSMMTLYSYGAESTLDYYATEIGSSSWGDYQYKLSKLADTCSPYIVDKSGNLTFTDFTYYLEKDTVVPSYNLGAFSGNGVTFEGLYMDEAAYFNITFMQPGIDGDAIVVTADNLDAEITVTLTQTLIPSDAQLSLGAELQPAVRRVSKNGILDLSGIDWQKNRAEDTYYLCITSTEETTYTMRFVGDWTSGVDYFDFSRSNSISPLAAGNNSIDKATQLPNGNYGGLVTYAGDKDYYKILSVYADNIDVTVKGKNLAVREFNAEGELLQTAEEEGGVYKLTVTKDNYICVEGSADISVNECNPYSLFISDAGQAYLKAELNAVLPDMPVVTSELKNNQVSISVDVEDGLDAFYSKDMNFWQKYDNGLIVTENERYFFKTVAENGIESQFVSLQVVGIDHEAPTVSDVKSDVTWLTNGNVIVTADFKDNTALDRSLYRIGEDGEWLEYVDGATVSHNAMVYFKAVDQVGNESEIASYEVGNIDKEPPEITITLSNDTTTPVQFIIMTVSTDDGSEIYWSTDNITAYLMKSGQTLTVTANGTFYFDATDAVGNTSWKQITFTNIDTMAPVITLSGDNQMPLQSSTLTATVDDGSDIYYSTDQQSWTKYENEIAVTENATYYFKASDAANNTGTAEYKFTNIDTTAPEITLVGDNETPLKQTTLVASVDDGCDIYYSTDQQNWTKYEAPISVTANGTYFFKAKDAAGNEGTAEKTFANIDTKGPDITLTGDNTTPLQSSTMSATTEEGLVILVSTDNETWTQYEGEIAVTENGTYYFKATDTAGNTGIVSITFANIDTTKPVITLSGDNETPLKRTTLTAVVDDGSEMFYSLDQQNWTKYENEIAVTENATYYFKASDAANNTGTAEYKFTNIDTTAPEITLVGDNETPLQSSTLTASTGDGSPIYYRIGDTGDWTEYKEPITVTENATYNFKATDAAGNEGMNFLTFTNIIQTPVSEVIPQTQKWEKTEDATQYIVEYSTDNFEHVIQVAVNSNSLDSFQMPANYQMRVKAEGGEWSVIELVDAETATEPKLIVSNGDGTTDVFFANAIGTWEAGYVAQHVGSTEDAWGGTKEYATLFGKNKLADIIEGSTDANILLMTDDTNGDGLFVDDIYSALPGSVSEQQSRIAQIDEIRAGFGNDIVDMTSQRFAYTGTGLTIRGGAGNDTIWANKGDNFLFGDAGNDRIVGASGNDVIAGGIGNDRMHGGGGDDIFTFCDNWGVDNVEQLEGGKITLWFAESKSQITATEFDGNSVFTNANGTGSVTVKGFALADISVRYGDDGTDEYKALAAAGAFEEFTSQKIFEESGKGILA